ncbi:MAG: DUF996 domain-containing protein, partial [Bacteroidales bacterium]
AVGLVLIVVGIFPLIMDFTTPGEIPDNFEEIYSLIFGSGLLIISVVLIFVFTILGYYFWFQSLRLLAKKTKVDYFRIAGLLYFIGAITSIILVGGLIILAAWIIHIVAYFNIQPEYFYAKNEEQISDAEKQSH